MSTKKLKRGLIFTELFRNNRNHPTTCIQIDCILIDEVTGDKTLPLLFTRAMNDIELSDNPGCIDATQRSIFTSIPKNMPYFMIEIYPSLEIGLKKRLIHIIENNSNFSKLFGFEILENIPKELKVNLGEDDILLRDNKKLNVDSTQNSKQRILNFIIMYKDFDFTMELD